MSKAVTLFKLTPKFIVDLNRSVADFEAAGLSQKDAMFKQRQYEAQRQAHIKELLTNMNNNSFRGSSRKRHVNR